MTIICQAKGLWRNLILLKINIYQKKSNASATLNMMIILMKNFIYKQRVNKSIAGFAGFMSYLKYYQTIEKNIPNNWKEHIYTTKRI